MSYKRINNLYKEKMKFNRNGNAIITLPPGTDRIQFQHEDKDGSVKDQQFQILLNEIRDVKSTLLDRIDAVDAKVDDVNAKVVALSSKVNNNTKAIMLIQKDLNRIVDKNNLKR